MLQRLVCLTILGFLPCVHAQFLLRQFGTPAADLATSVAVDNSGIYVAGSTEGTFPGESGSGGIDGFVRKYDRAGNPLWTRQLGTSLTDKVQSVASDATGVYIAGYTDSVLPGQSGSGQRDIFLRKYDPNGVLLWTRQFGSSGWDYGESVAAGPSGVYVAGWTTGALPGQIASGSGDAYVRKYDVHGNVVWTRQFHAFGGQTFAGDVALDASGIYVGGTTLGTFPGNAASSYDHDAYVRKYNFDGDHVWTRQWGTTENETCRIGVGGSGVYLAGTTLEGAIQPVPKPTFLRKYNGNGELLWARESVAAATHTQALAADASGVYLAGTARMHAFTYKYDPHGNFVWKRLIDTASVDSATGISVDAGGLFAVGYTSGNFPGQINAGSLDAYFVQLDRDAPPLRFIPAPGCRVLDTRSSPPALGANQTRSLTLNNSHCGVPSNARAYVLNATVVPAGPLSYLTLWPDREPRPLVSTLNSLHGGVVANAAIVPTGDNGGISAYATHTTELILDVAGYFVEDASPQASSFYLVHPCRLVDTRQTAGPLGGPSLAARIARTFPLLNGSCQILPWVTAYSLNATVVPHATLGYLTLWPQGFAQPFVSTLNSWEGDIVANAAIVTAGTGGAVNAFATDPTDLVLDTNGYFGPSGYPGELRFHPLTPCRVADTRADPPGGPIRAGDTRDFPFAGVCNIPAGAKAYSVNVTVVPSGPLGYLTMWPAGSGRPLVSTLNSPRGRVVANAAIVPAGGNGSVSVFVTNETHVVLDVNGYFR